MDVEYIKGIETLINKATVNGKIICRKMAKKNVVFPTYFFVSQIHDII